MTNWIEYAKQKPETMQMVHTAHAGVVSTDWVDAEMYRDADNGKKPVTWWQPFPVAPADPAQLQVQTEMKI